jgi:hypothetical protein
VNRGEALNAIYCGHKVGHSSYNEGDYLFLLEGRLSHTSCGVFSFPQDDGYFLVTKIATFSTEMHLGALSLQKVGYRYRMSVDIPAELINKKVRIDVTEVI